MTLCKWALCDVRRSTDYFPKFILPARCLFPLCRCSDKCKVQKNSLLRSWRVFKMTVNTRLISLEMQRFYLHHQSCTVLPPEIQESFIKIMKAAGSEVFPLLLPAWVSKEKLESPQQRSLKTHSRVEFSDCGFWIIYSSALCISISRIWVHACARVHVCMSVHSVNHLGN